MLAETIEQNYFFFADPSSIMESTETTKKVTETTSWSQTELDHIEQNSGITIFGQSNTSLDEVKRLRSQLHQFDVQIKEREAQQIERQHRTTTGKVKIVYERYDDLFELSNGTINVGSIDEEYCLSDVMPGCVLELINCSMQEKIQQEIKGKCVPFVCKDVDGKNWVDVYTYPSDVVQYPKTYWVLVYQDVKQREADLQATKERMALNNTDALNEGKGKKDVRVWWATHARRAIGTIAKIGTIGLP